METTGPATKPKVLLVGLAEGNVAAETSRLFRAAGCEIEAVCPARSWLLRGRRPSRWHQSPKSPEGLAAATAQAMRSGQYRWVVPVDDSALRALVDHLDEDLAAAALPVTDLSFRDVIGGKAALSMRCAQGNVPTPRFAIYAGEEQALAAAERIGFPVLLKVDRSGGGRGVARVENAAELEKALGAMTPVDRNNLVIQAYVSGDIVSAEALYRNGKLIAVASSRVISNVSRSEFDASAVREYARDEALERLAANLGAAIGAHGFASLTFMRDRATGEYFAIEADLRPHAWFRIAQHAGVNFSDGVRSFLGDGAPLPPQRREPIVLRHWARDILRCVLGHGDRRNLLAWVTGRGGRWRTLPWDDPRLFAAWAAEIARSIFYRAPIARPAMRAAASLFRRATR